MTSPTGARRRVHRRRVVVVVIASVVAAIVLAAVAQAGEAQLVKDIERASYGCSVSEFVEGEGALYFGTSSRCKGGMALWRTDGSVAGTRAVRSFAAGVSGVGMVRPLLSVDGVLYFGLADDDSFIARIGELWRSDGSAQGTLPVWTVPATASLLFESGRASVGSFAGKLVFTVSEQPFEPAPWVSDGTAEGTHRLQDVGGRGSSAYTFLKREDALFFVVYAGSTFALWRTDATTDGTTLVRDIGIQWVEQIALGPDGAIYFVKATAPGLRDLWRSEGTEQTTAPVLSLPFASRWVLVGDVHFVLEARRGVLRISRWNPGSGEVSLVRDLGPPPPGDNDLDFLAQRDGVLYAGHYVWQGSRERLWRSDGTPEGTFALYGPDSDLVGALYPAANGFLFVPDRYDAPDPLWHTDGTVAGTVQVLPADPLLYGVDDFVSIGDDTLFVARYQGRIELLRTDGTAAGTSLVRRLPGDPWPVAVRDAVVSFFTGSTLWRSDGTPDGTYALLELGPHTLGSAPSWLTDLGGTLFFAVQRFARDASELWRSDGTRAGTSLVAAFPSRDQALRLLTPLDDQLLFARGADELWASDGTAEGTRIVADDGSEDASRGIREIHAHAGSGYAAVRGSSPTDGALLRIDGDTWTSALVAPVAPSSLTTFAGELLFTAPTAPEVAALWHSDGTPSGTAPLATFSALSQRRRPALGTLFPGPEATYFSVGRHGRTELWRSDGTEQGTARVATLSATSKLSIDQGGFLDDVLLFSLPTDFNGGPNLWQSDGTEAGTKPVAAVEPYLDLGAFTRLGSRMFFLTVNPPGFFFPTALWVTDGTEIGTVELLDGRVVGGSLVAEGDLLYFCVERGSDFERVWRSDGTPQGTVPAFGRQLRCNDEIATSGGRLFFSAATARYGAELWSAPLELP